MFERKRSKQLDSISQLRSTQPGGNARNFINMKPDLGRRALMPSTINGTDMHIDDGVSTAKVRKV